MSARRALLRAEERLLEGVGCTAYDVALPSGASIHTVELRLCPNGSSAAGGGDGDVLVMLPGYGLGAAAYILCLEALQAAAPRAASAASDASDAASAAAPLSPPFRTVFALDWPGTGLSSPFDRARCRRRGGGDEGSGDGARDGAAAVAVEADEQDDDDPPLDALIGHAVDALEEWRIAVGVGRGELALLGHSLGGCELCGGGGRRCAEERPRATTACATSAPLS